MVIADRAARHRAALPEQRRGKVIDAEADLHAVAVAALTRIGIDRVSHDSMGAELIIRVAVLAIDETVIN